MTYIPELKGEEAEEFIHKAEENAKKKRFDFRSTKAFRNMKKILRKSKLKK